MRKEATARKVRESKIEKHCESFWETLRWLKNSTNQAKLLLAFFDFWWRPSTFRTYCSPPHLLPMFASSRSLILIGECLCNFEMIHYACRNTHRQQRHVRKVALESELLKIEPYSIWFCIQLTSLNTLISISKWCKIMDKIYSFPNFLMYRYRRAQ